MNSKFQLADIRSGLVVFLVALPLCLGVALASKTPIMSGIIAGVIGGIIVGTISNSRFSVSGPAAGLAGIFAAAVTDLTAYKAQNIKSLGLNVIETMDKKMVEQALLDQALGILFLAVIVAGIIQILFGLLRAGFLANFFPSSAIKGMLCGIGITLIMKQIPHFFGYDEDPEGDMSFSQADHENTFTELWKAIENICHPSLIIGAIGLFILILWEFKFIKKNKVLAMIPAPLLVVTMGVLCYSFFKGLGGDWIIQNKHLVDFPNIVEKGQFNYAAFKFPDFSLLTNPQVYYYGLIIAAVATIETLLCIEAVDKLDPEKYVTNQNRELIAQGTGNVVSGLVGGIAITSVIVRSSANINAGAQSKMSTIIHGLFLLVAVVSIPFVLKMIPYSALAAILIFTGYKLAKISIFKSAFKQGWKYWVPFSATIIVMLSTDLLKGVGVGVVIAFIFILIENMQSPFKINYEKVDGKMQFLIQVSQHITFLHKSVFIKTLNKIPENAHVVVDARKTKFMDRDVTELLNEFKTTAHHKNITVEYLNIKEVETLGH
jgi:MFS superfamily sulfate permease-like transporter